MKRGLLVCFFIMIPAYLFAWLGIEDEAVRDYPSLYSSLITRALEENLYTINNNIVEIAILNKNVKRRNNAEVEEDDSKRLLLYSKGRLRLEKMIGVDEKTYTKIEYNYDENGNIRGASSYEGENTIVKKSEYRYDSEGIKTEYRTYDSTGRLRVRHKFIYSDNKDGNNRITEEKIFNSAGINVLKIIYTYDDKDNLTAAIFLDYNNEVIRRQEYTYNSAGKVVKFTARNELNDSDGDFEYIYGNDGKLEKILFYRPFSDDGIVVYKFLYNEKGIIIEKNVFLIKEEFGETKIKRSIWNSKTEEDYAAVETARAADELESESAALETSKDKKTTPPEVKKVTETAVKAKKANKVFEDKEIKARIELSYKNSSFKKQNKNGREFYEIYGKNKKIDAYMFVGKNFGYSGELLTYIIIDVSGFIKDVYISNASAEHDETIQMLKKKDWFLKFKKINVKNVDITRRNFGEKIDGVAGVTVTTDAATISVWKAIELFNNITKVK